jgi:hypothetical protein
MAVAAGAEYPGAVALVRIALGIQHAGKRQVALVDLRILGVNMIDAVVQHADSGDRIDGLPEHMARVVITAHRFAGDGAQFQHRLRAVDHEAGVHLDSNLHAVIRGEPGMLRPVGRHNLVPLPGEELQILRRPRTRHPVRVFGFRRIARAAAEIDHHWYTQFLGQPDRPLADFLVVPGAVLVRMQRIAVTA